MSKLNLKSLQTLRENEKKKIKDKLSEGKLTTILVGMGTCGIAAGAKESMKTFIEQVEKMGLKDVEVKPTGCMGSCFAEPTVEVISPGMPAVLYGRVTPGTAKKILERHVVQKLLLNDNIFDKPAMDILK